MKALRAIIIFLVFIALWQLIIILFKLSAYILPSPLLVAKSLIANIGLIAKEAIPTIFEAFIGFICSIILGGLAAISLTYFRPARVWVLPILLLSQALPTFAIAPLFVVWFGYAEASKIATTILMLFFPITSAFYDGLIHTPAGFLDLAKTMNASKWQTLIHIQIPAATPSLGTGLRVAATFAPMGAVIGEWVGSVGGLGFLILQANARMQIDLMFAVLIVLILLTLLWYYTVDYLVNRLTSWNKKTYAY